MCKLHAQSLEGRRRGPSGEERCAMHFATTITRIGVRITALAIAAALMAFTLAACGSDDNESSTSGAGASTAAKSTSTAAETPKTNSAGVTDYVDYVGGKAGAADNSKQPRGMGAANRQGGANDVGPNSTIGAQ